MTTVSSPSRSSPDLPSWWWSPASVADCPCSCAHPFLPRFPRRSLDSRPRQSPPLRKPPASGAPWHGSRPQPERTPPHATHLRGALQELSHGVSQSTACGSMDRSREPCQRGPHVRAGIGRSAYARPGLPPASVAFDTASRPRLAFRPVPDQSRRPSRAPSGRWRRR